MSLTRVGLAPVCAAAAMLVAARLWLRVSPGAAVRWSASRSGDSPAPRRENAILDRFVRALAGVGARRPFTASCLEQGLALVMLLALVGMPARLVIGVARPSSLSSADGSALRAHAWVESEGRVLIGGAQAHGLVPLM